MEPAKKINPAIAALIVIVLIGAITAAVIAMKGDEKSPSESTTTSTESTNETAATDKSESSDVSSYTDGTYSATGSYVTPGGRESIDLEVTLSGGTITATSLTQNAESGEAEEYQSKFAGSYKSLVVGKKIDSVSLSRVAGSSLTSNGFNDAIDQIKTDASAASAQ